MKTSDRILEVLYDRREGYVALEELAAAVGVAPADLERELDAMFGSWYRLEYSPPDGVRLLPPVPLSPHLIERGLPERRVGRSVLCFEVVGSTNDVALEAIRQEGADGLVVVAEAQSRGRGRRGRAWVSSPHQNVLLSALLIEPAGRRAPPHEALTIATGLATAEAIEEAAGLPCELKWPNDVLLDGAKVAGVLVEMRREGETLGVVLGVGINANRAPPADEVDRRATCLADHLAHPADRIAIVRALLGRLDAWVARVAAGRLDELHAGFLARCRMVNQRLTVLCDGRRHSGRVLDVDPLEGLVLCLDDGSRTRLPAARATVLAEVR